MPIYTIEKVINKALGLSRTEEGLAIFIPHSLPGEEIKAKITKTQKDYGQAKIQNVLISHPERVAPRCKHLPQCGGCNLQHASSKLQPKIKTDIVRDNLHKIIGTDESKIEDCLPAPSAWNYRQRLRLHVDEYERIGFKKVKSDVIIQIKECITAKEEINQALQQLSDSTEHLELLTICEQIELLYNPSTALVTLIYHTKRRPRPADHNRSKRIVKEFEIIEQVYFVGEDYPQTLSAKKSSSEDNNLSISYQLANLPTPITLNWEVGGFCQVNLEQNPNMIEKVIDFSQVKTDDTVLDLYCGMGNFSIPLALKGAIVTGYEGQGAAVRSAKRNAQENKTINSNFSKGAIHKVCTNLIEEGKMFDCVIIDPPRQGAPQLAPQIAKLCAKRLIYISCDPATLGRDLAELKKEGFIIESIQPVDMFPQTHHIETIVSLTKQR